MLEDELKKYLESCKWEKKPGSNKLIGSESFSSLMHIGSYLQHVLEHVDNINVEVPRTILESLCGSPCVAGAFVKPFEKPLVQIVRPGPLEQMVKQIQEWNVQVVNDDGNAQTRKQALTCVISHLVLEAALSAIPKDSVARDSTFKFTFEEEKEKEEEEEEREREEEREKKGTATFNFTSDTWKRVSWLVSIAKQNAFQDTKKFIGVRERLEHLRNCRSELQKRKPILRTTRLHAGRTIIRKALVPEGVCIEGKFEGFKSLQLVACPTTLWSRKWPHSPLFEVVDALVVGYSSIPVGKSQENHKFGPTPRRIPLQGDAMKEFQKQEGKFVQALSDFIRKELLCNV